ncbi:uncharacterized protein LOC5507021 [Nematostella vectensis]|uniref:uncharacterized protein LOC5507021 n=1 Tax=Nematostella vectensis TaxID=45351 RepID=UPI0020772900|nr:uncharacterized protein LOC5507021 [Nematostella vectensis]
MKFAVALVLVAVASAMPSKQSGDVCVSPEQFVGRYTTYIHKDSGEESAVPGNMYYDWRHKRIRVDVQVEGVTYKSYLIYNEKVGYTVFGERCYKYALTTPFTPVELPADATLLESGRAGSSEHGLNVKRFHGKVLGVPFLATVTADECILVSSVGRKDDTTVIFSLLDVSRLEVTDDDFKRPTECVEVGNEKRSVEDVPKVPLPFL